MTRTQILGASLILLLLLFVSCNIAKNTQKNAISSDRGSQDVILFDNIKDATSIDPFTLGREYEILQDTIVNYLMTVFQLKKYETDYFDTPFKWNWMQAYPTYLSRLTNEHHTTKEAIGQWRNPRDVRYKTVSSEDAVTTNEAALSYLIQKCKDEKVVMINENHFAPPHRILAQTILDSLYNYGFRYFAMEAVNKNDTMLNKRGFAITNTGFYSREPMMANLIRKAIEKGYYVFGYDDFTSDREKNQAINIYQETLAKDSLAKVFVLAGFQHIDETDRVKNWMAREFLLLTGIDPFTIEQQEFVTHDNEYLMVLDTTILTNRRMTCDIFILNNIDYELFAVKNCYNNYNITIPKEIAEQAQNEHLKFIISIFREDEYLKDKRTIPVYNHVLNNSLLEISIQLPNSKYYYVIRDRYGSVIYQRRLE